MLAPLKGLLSFRHFLLSGFFFFLTSVCFAQDPVVAYEDMRGYLYVFENGGPRTLDTRPVRSYKSAGPYVGYVNASNNLIVYYNGEFTDLGDATNTTFDVNYAFLIYKRDNVLAVFEKGNLTRLTYFIKDYQISEGLIVFRETIADILKVYRDGNVQELETTLVGSLGNYAAGKNTVAFTNRNGYLKIFDSGDLFEVDNNGTTDFVCGKNTVAYTDGANYSFKVYYLGKIVTLEELKAQSFKAGDNVVAYVSDENYFKVYADGKLLKLESYAPDLYDVKDQCVAFYINNKFQAFVNGVRYELDNFQPLSYKISQGCIAWVDQNQRLHLFANGKSTVAATELFSSYDLNNDILSFKSAENITSIYYQGKTYR
ncbi:MAG: hypothetical protein ACKOX3_07660 [Bacteroidota bacterium]